MTWAIAGDVVLVLCFGAILAILQTMIADSIRHRRYWRSAHLTCRLCGKYDFVGAPSDTPTSAVCHRDQTCFDCTEYRQYARLWYPVYVAAQREGINLSPLEPIRPELLVGLVEGRHDA